MSIWEYVLRVRLNKKQKIIAAMIAAAMVILIVVIVALLLNSGETKEQAGDKIRIEIPEPDVEDPQISAWENEEQEEGAAVDIEEIVQEEQPKAVALGIDVSKYQGKIDWQKVANAGIEFAMIRVGYRTTGSGAIKADSHAKYNMQQADKYGIKVGVYFFSTAISEAEARQEADWVADYIANYRITYPVAYDCEAFDYSENRHYDIDWETRTGIAVAFLSRIAESGYSPLFYSSKSDMEDEIKWDMERISSLYSVWVAQYPSKPYPETARSTYSGRHLMWQYTNKGTVPGIGTAVDMNVSYQEYEGEDNPNHIPTVVPEPEEENAPAFNMEFADVNEQVTAKQETNLRDIPSQGADSKVLHILLNGQIAHRTGVSNSGWSRVVYNGNTYYAVSSLLTTDLTYQPPKQEPDDGIKTQFAEVNEQVTAKKEINLRRKPSVDDEIAPVVVKITNGEIITRTGVNADVGWSRVIWQGQTLYCVSQYLQVVE